MNGSSLTEINSVLQQEGQKPPYNWDNYAQAFFPKAEELIAEAEKAEQEGNQEKASELYLFVSPRLWRGHGANRMLGAVLHFTAFQDFQRLAQKSNDTPGKKARRQHVRGWLCVNVQPKKSRSRTNMVFPPRARRSRSITICHLVQPKRSRYQS